MADYAIDFKEIKEQVSIVSALILLGASGEPKRTGKGGEMATACPLPGCDGKTSFKFNPDKGVFRCFKCERGGDVIKLVQLAEGVTAFAAARRLAEHAGIPTNRQRNKTSETVPGDLVKEAELRSTSDLWSSLLDRAATDPGLAELLVFFTRLIGEERSTAQAVAASLAEASAYLEQHGTDALPWVDGDADDTVEAVDATETRVEA